MASTSSPRISRSKRITFSFILILLGAIAGLALLEAFVRVIGIRVSDDPFIHFGQPLSVTERQRTEQELHASYVKAFGRYESFQRDLKNSQKSPTTRSQEVPGRPA
jgi:hypothetical protein